MALFLFSLTVVLGGSMQAQVGGKGSINGTVTDSTGAVIPGATVTATEVATGVKTIRTTTSSGYYVLSPLDPGTYSVTLTAPGFQTLKQENVVVDALQVVGLNLTMQVGGSKETMVVSSAPPQLDTTSATLGGTIENTEYTALPLQMDGGPRDPTQFVYLMPGVSQGGVSGIFNGSGSQGRLDEIYIDGVPITRISIQGDPRNVSSAISVEAVNQFQVETSGAPVEYQGAGVQNYVVKSGTNKIHGSIFEYFRNTALDTWGWGAPAVINPLTGKATKPVEHQNEYGITLGAPILKDKIFFFGSYDGYRYNKAGNPSYYTIPTMLMRQGNFTELPSSQPIYDPATTVCSGKTCTRQQATYNGVANTFDPGRIGVAEQAMMKYMPTPTNNAITNNYLGQTPTNTFSWNTTEKVDAVLTPKQRISVIFAASKSGVLGYLSKGSQVPLPYTNGQFYTPKTKTLIFEHSYVVTSHLVNQFKYGFIRYYDLVGNPSYSTQYGIVSAAGVAGLPAGQVADSFPTVKWGGPNSNTQWSGGKAYTETTNTYDLLDNVQYVHGKHSFTFGAIRQWLQDNNTAYLTGTAPLALNYSNAETAAYNSGVLQTKTGDSFASFLLGQVDSAQLVQNAVLTTGARIRPLSLYAQDDYAVTPKLTLNIGLRWDYFPSFTEVQNRFSFLNPTMTNPVTGNAGALQFAGGGAYGCNCSTPVHNWYKNFGPRIGVAYGLNEKTVLRGGYSISYTHGTGILNATRLGTGQLGYTASPNPKSSSNSGIAAFVLDNGFPSYTPPPFINSSYGTGFSTNVSTSAASVSYGDPYLGSRAPYVINWNAGIERQLTQNMAISVNYVGSQGHFLPTAGSGARGIYSDQVDPKYYNLGSLLTAKASAATVAAAQAIDPSVALPYPTFSGTIGQMLRPFPQYNGVGDTYGNIVNSNYNALQMTLKQRMSNGLQFMLNYTYSHEIDDGGTYRSGYLPNRIERSRGTADTPQILSGTVVYDLPFGKGKAFANSNKIARAVASNWVLAGIYTYHSGNPLAITASGCNDPFGGSCMPNLATGFSGSARINGSWGKGALAGTPSPSYIDSTAFADPAAYTFGSAPRTGAYGLRGPGSYDIDMSVKRAFDLYENVKLLFDLSAYNLTNKVLFGISSTNMDSSNFGQISGQSNNSRDIQLAARINF
ncbi:MAG: outer membrane beta-barrel protein [Acidobacteriaceae bacterium]